MILYDLLKTLGVSANVKINDYAKSYEKKKPLFYGKKEDVPIYLLKMRVDHVFAQYNNHLVIDIEYTGE